MTDAPTPDPAPPAEGNIWDREPIAILGLVQGALIVATTFGADLSAEQTVAVLGLAAAVLTIVARRKVSPTDLDKVAAEDLEADL